jgi:GNAT superfamily N-acetyltransferase
MTDFIIRKARIEDLPTIKECMMGLYQSDRQYDTLFYEIFPEEYADEEYSMRIRGEGGVCFVAERGGDIIGCFTGALSDISTEYPPRRTRLEKIFVKEGFRDLGVGSALVQAFIEWSKQMGVSRVLVRAYAENVGAIELYKRCGFQPYILGLAMAIEEEVVNQQ